MTVNQFLELTKRYKPELPPVELLIMIEYCHNGKQDWYASNDVNQKFREELARHLFIKYTIADRLLIKYLFEQEIILCREQSISTDNFKSLLLCSTDLVK